jgi:glycosyltransferase involved in cell wall biosynthesis
VVQVCGLMHPHGALAARLEQTPVVWQLLSTFAPPVLRRVLMPVVVKLADVVMSTGRDTAREHPGACAMGERLVPFFPPVDTDQFRPDPVARLLARAELRVPPGALLVGTVGNMVWQKGHELLVDAVAELRGRHHPVYGRVLGSHVASQDRYYRENVIGRARKRGLLRSEVLTFSSPGDRVSQLLPAFDVFLLTSRAEGAPTVVLEAMACAVPVVATDVGSMREIVEDGRTGFVVRRGRVEPLVSAIEKLLRSPATRDAMGTVARRRAVERYGLGACADAHVRAFELAASVRRIAGTEPATDIGAAESC